MGWARFRAQYDAVGREKADGYDPAMFADMTGEERSTARAMLLERGDTTDLTSLRHLGGDAVVAALRAHRGRRATRQADRDIARSETLFVLTGDPADLEPILHYLDSGGSEARARAANSLARSDLPPALQGAMAARLASFRHRDVALPMVQAWLATQGVAVNDPARFQRYLPLIRRITGRPWWRRRALLKEIASSLATIRDARCSSGTGQG